MIFSSYFSICKQGILSCMGVLYVQGMEQCADNYYYYLLHVHFRKAVHEV